LAYLYARIGSGKFAEERMRAREILEACVYADDLEAAERSEPVKVDETVGGCY
jgi:hypothetical protein